MSDKPDPNAKPLPPITDTVILRNILEVDRDILKEIKESQTILNNIQNNGATTNMKLDQILSVLHESLDVQEKSLSVQEDSKEILQQILEEVSSPPPEQHIYTILVRPFNLLTFKHRPKEGKSMAQRPGVGTGYGANMQDNGNNIPLPEASSFAWSTDDTTDVIQVSPDSMVAVVTVSDPPATGRNTITITAAAVDPNGDMQSGSYTTDLVAGGLPHVFSVSVAPLEINPLSLKGFKKTTNPGRKK